MGTAARKKQATDIITSVFRGIKEAEVGVAGVHITIDARLAGRMMVSIYRLLTGEMPQSPGIEIEFRADELPAVELASPTERGPNRALYVQAGGGPGEPDVIWEEGDHAEEGIGSSLDGARPYQGARGLQPPKKGKA